MADPRDQFFNELFNQTGAGAEEIKLQRQLSFEERIVKRVFSECGIKRTAWGMLVNDCRQTTGHDKLNFNWFNATYRDFPARLCGKRIPYLHELTVLDIFKKPNTANRLARAIHKNLSKLEVDCSRNFVFVFPVVRTMFCAHNLDLDATNDCARVHWRVDYPAAANLSATARRLIVEPTFSLFSSVGSDWCN